jgi:MtrB/PioB family decaheme-associated outer membrane protein
VNDNSMIHRSSHSAKILWIAFVSAGLTPLQALAQDEDALRELTQAANEVEIGVGYVDDDSYKFGDYTGLHEKGPYFIGNFWLHGREDGTARFWRFSGTNIGLRSRNLQGEYTDQGNYRFYAEYDQLPKFRWDDAVTPFIGAGGNTLTLPPGWVPGANTAGMTQLGSSLVPLQIDHERRNYIFGFNKVLGANWGMDLRLRHETREGTKLTGAVIGNTGGNPRAALIPEPIDYETNELEAGIAYADRTWQFRVGYLLSLFGNRNDSLTWQNPYSQIAGWAPGVGYPTGSGRLSLAPDNEFHQISASVGYNFTDFTRFTGNFALGRMTQDQPFLPYSVNPVAITTGLPRESLDGRIDTTLLNLAVTSRPMPRLNVRASYRYDDRDNKTPQAQYIYVGGDSQNQATTLATDRARTNLPLSYRQQLIKAEGDYEIVRRTKLEAGYHYEEIKRTFAEAEKVDENTILVGLRRSMTDMIDGSVRYSHGKRRNKGYADIPFVSSYSPEFIATLPPGTQWDNHPLLRKFTYADRDRDKLKLALGISPTELVSVQLRADFNQDDYDNSILGLTESSSRSYTIDGAFTPNPNTTLYAFYTYDRYESEQNGRSFNAAQKLGQETLLVSPNDWFNTMQDRIDTIGIGVKFKDVGRWDVGADFTYSDGSSNINTVTGPGIAVAGLPLPEITSRLNVFQVYGKYNLRKNLALRVSWWYQKLQMTDWAYTDVGPATMANVLGTGQSAPNYSVNVIGVSLIARYW